MVTSSFREKIFHIYDKIRKLGKKIDQLFKKKYEYKHIYKVISELPCYIMRAYNDDPDSKLTPSWQLKYFMEKCYEIKKVVEFNIRESQVSGGK